MTEENPKKARGKWARLGVPHRGWHCIETRDLREEGQDYQICAMCESQEIRFVHTMEHPEYPETLECGCDCAGHMEGSPQKARDREVKVKNRAVRRENFPNRKAWKESRKGNPYIKVEGYFCVVARRLRGYSVGITPPGAEEPKWGDITYPDIRAAQMGCFDAIEYMKSLRTG